MGRNLYYEDEILEEKFNGFMFKRLLSYAAEYRHDYIKAALLMALAAFLSLLPTAVNMKIIYEYNTVQGTFLSAFICRSKDSLQYCNVYNSTVYCYTW